MSKLSDDDFWDRAFLGLLGRVGNTDHGIELAATLAEHALLLRNGRHTRSKTEAWKGVTLQLAERAEERSGPRLAPDEPRPEYGPYPDGDWEDE